MEHDAGEGRSPHSSGINLQPLANDVPARIENPKDLLGEALKRLSPQKTQEILGTAAELDLMIASRQLDQTAAAARQLAEAETFRLEDEHRSASGYTRVTVSKDRPDKPPE